MKMDVHKSILLIVTVTVSLAFSMLFSFFSGRDIAQRYAALIDASVEIKFEATIGHLWFEEMIAGDRSINLDEIWQHLDQAEWYAQAMLDGGENEEGFFYSLSDPDMRLKIENTKASIQRFHNIAQERWEHRDISGIGSDIDQDFDQIFLEFLGSVSEVEVALKEEMKKDLKQFGFEQGLLILLVGFMGLLTAVLVYRHNIQRTRTMQELQDREENLRITFNAIGDAVIVTDVHGHVTYLNPIAESLTGWLLEEAIDQPLVDIFNIVNAQTLALAENPVEKVLATGKIVGLANHTMLISRNGEQFQISDSGAPIYSIDGDINGVVLVFQDVTEEYALQEALKSNEFKESMRSQVLALLLESNPLTSIFESLIEVIEEANTEVVCSILLLDEQKKHLLTGAAPNLPDFYNEAIHGLEIADGVGSCGTAAFTGQQVIVEDIQTHPYWSPFKELAAKAGLGACWSQPIIGSNNSVLGTFAIYHHERKIPQQKDIDLIVFAAQLAGIAIEKHQANEKVSLSANVFTNTHEGIIITDENGFIIDVNPAFCDITGYSLDDVTGKNPRMLSSGKQSPEFYQAMWQQINDQGHWQGEVWNRKKSGEIYAEVLSLSALKNDDEEVTHYIAVFMDITSSKKQQEQLSLMAHYDVLTGLPNRSLFIDRFNQAIAHSKRTENQLAVCFLDLDNFKPINDNYGHEVGDDLLVEVASRIEACIREEDTVSRQGGDEFALLLNDIESFSQCEPTLTRIHDALAQPYIINDVPHKITASSGITLYPSDNGDIDTLLRHADQAMYQAKLEGKHRYHLFSPESDQRTIQKHHKLEEIEHALENGDFQLYFQPKVNMVTGEVFGVEALIRWIHPKKGLIPPLNFLPIVEDTELEIKIGGWVINQALEQLEVWHTLNIKPEVSVNISSHHLVSAHFLEQLDAALSAHPSVDSQCLQLEILESSALGDLKAIGHIIQTCQSALGLSVALDDFGTGYSSLTHLRSLTADTVKIDQSFVRDMLDDPNDYNIIDGVIGLADAFNRDVIAEGVETTEHGLMLLVMGCEHAQGYGIAKPMPADDFPRWLSDYTPNKEWIHCGNKHRNEKESKVMLFQLTTEQWKNKFVASIQAPPENVEQWPMMNAKHCHCGAWIKRAKQAPLFENEKLESLEQAHKQAHSMANELLLKYQQNDIESAREGLLAFQAIIDDMNHTLELL